MLTLGPATGGAAHCMHGWLGNVEGSFPPPDGSPGADESRPDLRMSLFAMGRASGVETPSRCMHTASFYVLFSGEGSTGVLS